MKKRKEERDRLRQFPLTEEETALLIKESQHMKAAHKLTKKSLELERLAGFGYGH